ISTVLRYYPSFPTRRSADLVLRAPHIGDERRLVDGDLARLPLRFRRLAAHALRRAEALERVAQRVVVEAEHPHRRPVVLGLARRSEEHTSELQSREKLVCRL